MSEPELQVPLVVDVDGTLVRSDMLMESVFARLSGNPLSILQVLSQLFAGKAALKEELAHNFDMEPARLPYDEAVLAMVRQAADAGRPVYLASASNKSIVERIATHLGCITGVFASDSKTNLRGSAKAAVLKENFGEQGFDYVGNDATDLEVWPAARQAFAVRAPKRVISRLKDMHPDVREVSHTRPKLRDWLKLFRVHHYVKNGLVFVPVLTSHSLSPEPILLSFLAACAFSLCASAIYVLNDLVDLQADREHPSKQHRPLTNGTIPLMAGMASIPLLLACGFAIAINVSLTFALVLLGYLALTTAYSFSLKRKMMVDTITLASLYTIRVVGGAAAIGDIVSEWLLAFSMFLFACFALIKRYVELAERRDANLPSPTNRNYQIGDLEVIGALAAAAGFNAVTVFALYISSDAARDLYSNPQLLWLVCPILMYWMGRALIMAHRRLMDSDPVVFALKDRVSQVSFALVCLITLAAI